MEIKPMTVGDLRNSIKHLSDDIKVTLYISAQISTGSGLDFYSESQHPLISISCDTLNGTIWLQGFMPNYVYPADAFVQL